mgnify:FL=1
MNQDYPWYINGLAFECLQCGNCCAGPAEGYVWVTQEDIVRIAEYLGISEKEMRRRYVRKVGGRFSLVEQKKTKDCIFLENSKNGRRRCLIYPVRPIQCQTWPFWPMNLIDPDAWCQAGKRCPGINRGNIHDYEEIKRKLSQINP